MRLLIAALLYTATLGQANAAPDIAALEALREGDMRKLIFHSEPVRGSDLPFETVDGAEMTLADLPGDYVVVNFWATWCAPCRYEMPMLSDLQAELGSDRLQIVTIATGRNPVPAMRDFFDQIGVDNLPLHRDPTQALARDMGVLGLPVTLILDPDRMEIARLQGDADWSSPSATAILTTLIE